MTTKRKTAVAKGGIAKGDAPKRGNYGSLIDPAALMRIKSLQVRAKVVVEGFLGGLHRSPFHGFSVEFSEYRQYSPGDDPRFLDWRLFARSDRYYVKRYEDETNLLCHVVLDMSRSMGFGSLSYKKSDYARTVAATLGYFLSQQRDAVGLLTFDERVGEYLPARYRPGHLHQLMVMLERAVGGKSTDLKAPLEQIAEMAVRRGMIILISDLLTPPERVQRSLGMLRSRGHEVTVFRVLDPAERDFSFDKPSLFHDLESGRQLYIDPSASRADYLRQFNQHEQKLKAVCSELGIEYVRLETDKPLELSLFDFVSTRMTRGGTFTRRGSQARRRAR